MPGRAWAALSILLALGSVLAWWLPAALLDWQPARAAHEPWRAITAAFVHWSPLHLFANLLACSVVGAFGVAARLPRAAALAWAAAWPLGHAALAFWPELAHYGGLSGLLHGGVAVAVLWMVAAGAGRVRAVGAMVLTGLVVKLLLEAPWGPLLRTGEGWDIATAPIAHATGAVAGALCVAVAGWASRAGQRESPP